MRLQGFESHFKAPFANNWSGCSPKIHTLVNILTLIFHREAHAFGFDGPSGTELSMVTVANPPAASLQAPCANPCLDQNVPMFHFYKSDEYVEFLCQFKKNKK